MKVVVLVFPQEEAEGAQGHLNSVDEICPSFLIAKDKIDRRKDCVNVFGVLHVCSYNKDRYLIYL